MKKVTVIALIVLTSAYALADNGGQANERGGRNRGPFTAPTFDPVLTNAEKAQQEGVKATDGESIIEDLRSAVIGVQAYAKYATDVEKKKIGNLIRIAMMSMPRHEKKDSAYRSGGADNDNSTNHI